MSFSDQLVLDDEFGAVIGTFNLVAKDVAMTSRVDAASTAAQPRHLITRHQMGNGAKAVDRHTVSVQETRMDSNNASFQATTSLSIVLPRTSAFDLARVRQDLQILIAYLCDSHTAPNISSDNLAALLRGES
jgi:hypothetical protein